MKIYSIVNGCGFPYFASSATLIMTGNENILIDTSTHSMRDKLIDNLKKLNLEPDDIGHLIFTHMHIDHYGNLDLFPNAIIYTTYPEFEFYKILHRNKEKYGRDFIIKIWKGLENWKPFTESNILLEREFELYESIKEMSEEQEAKIRFVKDGDVLFDRLNIFRCYGHSVDHIGIKVRYCDNDVLIIGDIFPNKRSVERIRDTSKTANIGLMYGELNYKLVNSLGNIIIPGHDRAFNLVSCEYVHFLKIQDLVKSDK
jgi:glyoxylase-like metal-dependent hydrolase (beta-lactamase superfamily II)